MLQLEVDSRHQFSLVENARQILKNSDICSKITNAVSLIFKLAATGYYFVTSPILAFSGFVFSMLFTSEASKGMDNLQKVLCRDSMHDSGARKVANFIETIVFGAFFFPYCSNVLAFFSGINLALDVLKI